MQSTTAPRRVAVFGATGSIGASALDVIARHPDRYRATVLAAGTQVQALVALCALHRPAHAVIASEALYADLRDGLRAAGLDTQAHAGAPPRWTSWPPATHATPWSPPSSARPGCPRPWPPPALASASCWPTRNRWSWPASC
ncbi:hypothetical protein QE447_000892 [Stenotrophomonas sp. SORGH_AS282]|nr:hypothetical protein [Stenotrophomonas sp. SORGH_AS_0282]